MVQKHKMIADFEKLTYDAEMLKEAWKKSIDFVDDLVKANYISHHLVSFIKWINGNAYSGILFPGFSLGNLLISKPVNGRLNYQQTLSIRYDNQTELFTMQYSDWDLIESVDEFEKAITWVIQCPGVDLTRHFIEFMEWKQNWKPH